MINILITKAIRADRASAGGRTRLTDSSFLAEAYAEHVLDRVAKRGQIYRDGGARESFKFGGRGRRSFFVSSEYAKKATGDEENTWGSSQAFHRAASARAGWSMRSKYSTMSGLCLRVNRFASAMIFELCWMSALEGCKPGVSMSRSVTPRISWVTTRAFFFAAACCCRTSFAARAAA